MEKLKLHYNELDLIGKTRLDGVLYTIYLHELEENEQLDSGFEFDEEFGEVLSSALKSTFEKAICSLSPDSQMEVDGFYTRNDSDNYGTILITYWIDESPITIIDWINMNLYSILIFPQKNDGENEEIIKVKNPFIYEAFQNYLENGVFKVLD
jgi:hypothetical protein